MVSVRITVLLTVSSFAIGTLAVTETRSSTSLLPAATGNPFPLEEIGVEPLPASFPGWTSSSSSKESDLDIPESSARGELGGARIASPNAPGPAGGRSPSTPPNAPRIPGVPPRRPVPNRRLRTQHQGVVIQESEPAESPIRAQGNPDGSGTSSESAALHPGLDSGGSASSDEERARLRALANEGQAQGPRPASGSPGERFGSNSPGNRPSPSSPIRSDRPSPSSAWSASKMGAPGTSGIKHDTQDITLGSAKRLRFDSPVSGSQVGAARTSDIRHDVQGTARVSSPHTPNDPEPDSLRPDSLRPDSPRPDSPRPNNPRPNSPIRSDKPNPSSASSSRRSPRAITGADSATKDGAHEPSPSPSTHGSQRVRFSKEE